MTGGGDTEKVASGNWGGLVMSLLVHMVMVDHPWKEGVRNILDIGLVLIDHVHQLNSVDGGTQQSLLPAM